MSLIIDTMLYCTDCKGKLKLIISKSMLKTGKTGKKMDKKLVCNKCSKIYDDTAKDCEENK